MAHPGRLIQLDYLDLTSDVDGIGTTWVSYDFPTPTQQFTVRNTDSADTLEISFDRGRHWLSVNSGTAFDMEGIVRTIFLRAAADKVKFQIVATIS